MLQPRFSAPIVANSAESGPYATYSAAGVQLAGNPLSALDQRVHSGFRRAGGNCSKALLRSRSRPQSRQQLLRGTVRVPFRLPAVLRKPGRTAAVLVWRGEASCEGLAPSEVKSGFSPSAHFRQERTGYFLHVFKNRLKSIDSRIFACL